MLQITLFSYLVTSLSLSLKMCKNTKCARTQERSESSERAGAGDQYTYWALYDGKASGISVAASSIRFKN